MGKFGLISDVHGNIHALNAVMKELKEEKIDEWICLGDIVGYGPYPSECISVIREHTMTCILGNHDAGVAGLLSLNHFREPNRTLIEQTRTLISEEDMQWLKQLPLIYETEEFIAAHASPIEPEKWKYMDSAFTVRSILGTIKQPLCFIGHTHKPVLVSDSFGVRNFQKGSKFLINPGSVGQSRDGDSRASCTVVDTDNWEYKNIRVAYDMEPVLTGLMKLGFSRKEADHLMKV